MILHIAITTLLASMSACSDEMDSVLTQRDWDGTATYFQSADEHGFSMYYKPQVGFVGDPEVVTNRMPPSVQEVPSIIRLINSTTPSTPAINSNLLPTRMHR